MFDTEVLILDEKGELVALSKHILVVVEGPKCRDQAEWRFMGI
jgi:hypothetical protein